MQPHLTRQPGQPVVDQVAASHLPHMPLLEETFFAADPCV